MNTTKTPRPFSRPLLNSKKIKHYFLKDILNNEV